MREDHVYVYQQTIARLWCTVGQKAGITTLSEHVRTWMSPQLANGFLAGGSCDKTGPESTQKHFLETIHGSFIKSRVPHVGLIET